jgi:hypothetical protein
MKRMTLLEDIEAFSSASPSSRGRAVKDAIRRLGDDEIEPLHAETGLVRHRGSGLVLLVVAGGRFSMGASEPDLRDARDLVAAVPEGVRQLEEIVRHAVPVREVLVRPFLCTVSPLTYEEILRLSGGSLRFDTLGRREALDLAASVGMRLPTEAELEWVVRDGRGLTFMLNAVSSYELACRGTAPARIAVRQPLAPIWAADDWHDDYSGAPRTSEVAWMKGDSNGVYRGGATLPVQDRLELLDLFAPLRRYGLDEGRYVPDCMVRLCRSL